MNVVAGLLIAGLLLAAVVWFALQSVRWSEEGDVPKRRPAWLGPDAVAMSAALVRELTARREAAGLPPLLECAATSELAAHHAFDMAMRGYAVEEDPEGVDLGGRRHRLHPGYVGRLWEVDLLLEPTGPSTEDSLMTDMCRTPAWVEALARADDSAINAVGVGVAVEEGRCALCLVFGAWWATIEHTRLGEAGVGGWRLEGRSAPGVSVADLAGQLTDGGDILPATPHEDPILHPDAFSLILPFDGDASGLRATVLRCGEPGLVRVLR